MRTWLPMVVGVALLGCNRSEGGERGAAQPEQMTAQKLRAVGTTASLDLPLQAAVYVWRASLPGDTRGKTVPLLMVSVQLRGGVVPPKALACDGIYLVFGETVFEAPPAEQHAGDGPGAVECILRGGPEWPVGALLQVIVSVRADAQRTLIRREALIEAAS